MHQETNSYPSTGKSDLMLFFAMVAALVVFRFLLTAAKMLPCSGLLQLLIFAAVVLLCRWLYKKRLCSYRFTVYTSEPDPNELDEFGDPRKNPFPLGALVAESMVGNKGKIIDIILPEEMTALLPPGEKAGKASFTGHLSVDSKKTAHTLLYTRNGKKHALSFHPGDELIKILNEILAAKKEA